MAPAGLWDSDFKVTLFAVIPPRGQRAKQGWRCTKFRSTALHGWMGSLSTLALLEPAVVCWRTTTVLHMHSYHTESPSVCEDPSSHVHSKKITRSRMATHTHRNRRVWGCLRGRSRVFTVSTERVYTVVCCSIKRKTDHLWCNFQHEQLRWGTFGPVGSSLCLTAHYFTNHYPHP